jgi:hypothetical protein
MSAARHEQPSYDEYFSPQAACGDLGSVPLVDEEDRPAVAHPVVFERERHNRHLRPAERAGLRRERRMCHDDTALIARDRLREHCKRLADRRVVRAPQLLAFFVHGPAEPGRGHLFPFGRHAQAAAKTVEIAGGHFFPAPLLQ